MRIYENIQNKVKIVGECGVFNIIFRKINQSNTWRSVLLITGNQTIVRYKHI